LQVLLITKCHWCTEPDSGPDAPTLSKQAIVTGNKISICLFSKSQMSGIGGTKPLLYQSLCPFSGLLQFKCNGIANLAQRREKVCPLGEILNSADLDHVGWGDDQGQVASANVAEDQLNGIGLQTNAHLGLIIKGTA